MGSVLIAMRASKDADFIAEMLRRKNLFLDIEICKTAAEALRIANERDFGAVICSKALPDMNYAELEECLPRYFGMILLLGDPSFESGPGRITPLVMPVRSSTLAEAVVRVTGEFSRTFRKESTQKRRRSAAEQQVIDEAKHMLMNSRKMTEPEAYRCIQKYSMDAGRSLLESAQMLLAMESAGNKA